MIDTFLIRKKVLDLAIQGKLTQGCAEDSSIQEYLYRLSELKEMLLFNKIIKKEKVSSFVMEEDNPFEIPSTWEWCNLVDICKRVTDGTHKTPHYISEGIPFLSVKNVSSGSFDFSDTKYISKEEHLELLKRCAPEKNDILFCRIGTLGKAIEIDFEPDFSIFVSLGLIKPLDSQLSGHLVNVFNSGYGDAWIKQHRAGDSMHAAKINLDMLRAFKIPLPPIEEQHRINKKVTEIFDLLDNIDELQLAYSSDLEILKSKIIDYGIQGKLTEQFPEDGNAEDLYVAIQEEKAKLIKEKKIKKQKKLPEITADEIPFDIPDNWKWVRLSDIFSVINGDRGKNYPAKSLLSHEGIPFISALNLDGNVVVDDDKVMCMSEEQYDKLSNGKMISGDVIVCIRGSLGKHGINYFEKGAIASSLVICRSHMAEGILSKYLMIYLDSDLFQKEIRKYNSGVAQPNLAANNLEKFLLPLPPIKEQMRIVEKINNLISAFV